jgi:hypothetical protein
MKQDSVRSAVSALILTIAVNVWIQCFTANSGLSALFGRCQETEGKGKSIGRRGDRGMGRKHNHNIKRQKIKRHGDREIRG